ncbi:MAG: hypothetical protein Q9214_002588 [Letrouitia sp. 1 TL-2023]
MADSTPKSYYSDPTLYLYTSLTAGSSHIITATSRLETILKANRIPFQALDVATDERARMLWSRRAGKRKLPGLVRMGMLVGDLEEIEEWNEYGELKEKVGVSTAAAAPSAANTPSKAPPNSPATPSQPAVTQTSSNLLSALESPAQPTSPSNTENPMTAAMRKAGFEAAKKAEDAKSRATQKVLRGSKSSRETQKKLDNTEVDEISASSGTTESKINNDDGADGTVSKQESGVSDNVEVAVSKTTLNDKDETVAEGSRETNDPDKEAVVPRSKDTIKVKDEGKVGSMYESNGLDQEAAGSISKVNVGMTDADDADDADDAKSATDSEDPDKEAVVPESKKRIAKEAIMADKNADPKHKSENEEVAGFFKTLVDHEVTVELKNNISIRGTLKSVDQFLNFKLDDIQVLEESKYPHLRQLSKLPKQNDKLVCLRALYHRGRGPSESVIKANESLATRPIERSSSSLKALWEDVSNG